MIPNSPVQAYYRGMADCATALGAALAHYLGMADYGAVLDLAAAGRRQPGPPKALSATQLRQANVYLTLLKKTLTRYPLGAIDQCLLPVLGSMDQSLTWEIVVWAIKNRSGFAKEILFHPAIRAVGLDLPAEAETMVGLFRLENLQHCIVDILRHDVPGDLLEAGVWRGGASIFMRAVLKAYGDTQRNVWLADSFQGLPKPDPASYPADQGEDLWTCQALAVPLETVKHNFERYGLLDRQVRFLRGWFRDTLPKAPIEKLALLRLDGSTYESTIVGLRSLYPKISKGGYLILDDYGAVAACLQAVNDFRREFHIEELLHPIDWTGVFWQVNREIDVPESRRLDYPAAASEILE
jgi:O-methyltransferase